MYAWQFAGTGSEVGAVTLQVVEEGGLLCETADTFPGNSLSSRPPRTAQRTCKSKCAPSEDQRIG
jgi:hypothetical protein